jgi:hypothetical protein
VASGGWAGALDGMDRAQRNAHEEWKRLCWEVINELARTRNKFTTEDVWDIMRTRHPGVTTHEPRAMGSQIKRAVDRGLVEKTKDALSSKRETSNTTDVWVYRSKLRGLPPEPSPAALATQVRQLQGELHVAHGELEIANGLVRLLADKLAVHEPHSDLLTELAL